MTPARTMPQPGHFDVRSRIASARLRRQGESISRAGGAKSESPMKMFAGHFIGMERPEYEFDNPDSTCYSRNLKE